ncbi:MAG TPA: hypothetical protein PKZ69_01125 [Candidatus Cloacimonadota bacterium]|nr:hypothetical protein [Candidatus Cloacimonadota bacterium]
MAKEHLQFKSILNLIGGIIVLLLAFIAPNYILNMFKPEVVDALVSTNQTLTAFVLFFITLAVVIISGLLIAFINKNQDKIALKLIGIIGLIIMAAAPSLVILVDSSFETLGIMYFIALIVAVGSWAGYALIVSFIHKVRRSQ